MNADDLVRFWFEKIFDLMEQLPSFANGPYSSSSQVSSAGETGSHFIALRFSWKLFYSDTYFFGGIYNLSSIAYNYNRVN